MSPASILSHVALLVPSAEQAALNLKKYDFPIAPAQEFEKEGTREIYVGDLHSQQATLLLMESIKQGPYAKALQKRGPGLHHIAIDVLDLTAFMEEISGSGWLLHPQSLKTIEQIRVAYLCRPGVPTMMEVQERESLSPHPSFIQEIRIPHLGPREMNMFLALGLKNISSTSEELSLLIQNTWIRFGELL